MAGFTDKGQDTQVQWVNTKKMFINEFGYPTNEIENICITEYVKFQTAAVFV